MGILQLEYDFHDDLDDNVVLQSESNVRNNLLEAQLSQQQPDDKRERL
jgi:hypothetical protein